MSHASGDRRRSRMAAQKSENTGPELRAFALMERMGLAFERHVRAMPGTPDAVLTGWKVAVFVDGDFWHGWQLERWVGKLSPFWRHKIGENKRRDALNERALHRLGWAVARLWEHEPNLQWEGTLRSTMRMAARRPPIPLA